MKPSDYYAHEIATGARIDDPEQMLVLKKMDAHYFAILKEYRYRHHLLTRFFKKKISVQGLYLYGKVGVGKTFLMDTFYQCLPFKNKLRIHFHAFMQRIHIDLARYQ